MQDAENPCPCGSGAAYVACCGPYLEGRALAPDPEALMRSRYTAFTRNDIPYLKKTWHPETLPDDLDDSEPSNWIGLEILETAEDEEGVEGEVEFIARLIHDDKLETLHELSHFDKIDGRWLYHSGEFKNDGARPRKIGRNAACPCGSGKSFKNCHGA